MSDARGMGLLHKQHAMRKLGRAIVMSSSVAGTLRTPGNQPQTATNWWRSNLEWLSGARMVPVSELPSIDKPSSARIYDYALGGTHWYAIDREFAEKQFAQLPDMKFGMRSNRAFSGRAVEYALGRGIRQFVDIGSGLPSQGQPHEIADKLVPGEARVVYIDKEPIAHAHSEILLEREADPERHKAVFADFFDVDLLWAAVLDTGVIAPEEPTCLLATGILHFFKPEQHPEKKLAYYCNQLVPDSLLILTHAVHDLDDPGIQVVAQNYSKTTDSVHLRTRDEFHRFFGEWQLVEPGMVWAVEWRPDGKEDEWWSGAPARCRYVAGVAQKPRP